MFTGTQHVHHTPPGAPGDLGTATPERYVPCSGVPGRLSVAASAVTKRVTLPRRLLMSYASGHARRRHGPARAPRPPSPRPDRGQGAVPSLRSVVSEARAAPTPPRSDG